jgi:hypothetical protein
MEPNRLDEIAGTLDDIATILEELKEQPCSGTAKEFERMRQSIERATDAIDRIEDADVEDDRPR